MRKRGARRLLLDLTPLIDVIMILLFGVMIHSVAKTEVETTAARGIAVAAEDRAGTLEDENEMLRQELLAAAREGGKWRAEFEAVQKTRNAEKDYLAAWVADLLLLGDNERSLLRARFDAISPEDLDRIERARRESGAIRDPASIQRAIRKIEEMEKVFTFVDMHLGADDFLALRANGRPIERIAVRERTAREIEGELRRALEAVSFSQTVLLFFSYDGAARILTAQATEEAIGALIEGYRTGAGGQNRQFRYAKVGRLEAKDPSAAKEPAR